MNSKKIIICTTFRDFNGTENDDIQKLFLQSLQNQTYKNFELIITLFGEKNVKKEVEKYRFRSIFFVGKTNSCKYSLTQVILNAVNYCQDEQDFIILWTTCDVVYDKNFFEEIIKNYCSKLIGTSHPYVIFPSVNDYFDFRSSTKAKLFSGFDLIFFDDKILRNEEIIDSLNKYVFKNWGIFEHFLISLNELDNNVNMVNLYKSAKIYKIKNDRKLLNESNKFLLDSWNYNFITFKNFIKKHDITDKYLDLTYCHLKFRLTKNKLKHYISFRNDLILYVGRILRRHVYDITPMTIKTMYKKNIKGGK